MSKIERFEDLDCWKKARELVSNMYRITNTTSISHDFAFRDQIHRASISTMTNIAEGFARFNKMDFVRFLNYSQSSAAEVKSLLYIALDLDYLPKEEIEKLQNLCDSCRFMTLGLIKHLKSNKTEDEIVMYEP